MNGLVKRLRDEICAASKDYLYESSRDNFEIIVKDDNNKHKKAKCVKAVEFDASQVYFKDKKECKEVAKIINHIFKAERKLTPKHVKVGVVFTEKDTSEEDFTKLHYNLYINDKLITKNGSVFSRVGYEVYSKEHILTTILIQIMSDYALALEFNCLKTYEDINEFRKEYGYNNVEELLELVEALKKICKYLKPLKIDKEEAEEYKYLLDRFDNDYNDKMLKEPIIKKLTDKYFNIFHNQKLNSFIEDEEN